MAQGLIMPQTMPHALYLCAMKILMVCLGNICRSPIAEAILQKKADEAGLSWTVDSAGTNGFHIGEAPHRLSQKVCKQNGLDISGQLARKFTKKDLADFDLIYAMADDVVEEMRSIAGTQMDESKTCLFLDALHPNQNKNVPDPWYGNEDGFTEVYQLIDKTCDAIIANHQLKNRK